jgi:hypothetical protein
MPNENEAIGQGLGEPAQAEIEERALELARAAGRDAMNEYDLATAREEILGKKSSPTDAPAEEDVDSGPDEPGEVQPS